jgi:hypothetical protein
MGEKIGFKPKFFYSWLPINLGYAGLIYYGYYKGADWAMNIILFVIWLHLIMSFLSMVYMASTEADVSILKKHKDSLSVPKDVNFLYDIFIALWLVGLGSIFLGTLWFLGGAFQAVSYEKLEKI